MGTLVFVSLLALSGCGSDEPQATSSAPASSAGSEVSSAASAAPSEPEAESQASEAPLAVTAGALPEGERVDSSYFDDAVFIGDSVSRKLDLYTTAQRKTDASFLGQARFLTAGSLGIHNAMWDLDREDAVHPSYQGAAALLEDSIAKMGAKKVYLMLGMNDIGLYGVDDSVTSMQTLVERILEKSPDARIYIQSVTPMIAATEGKNLNNTTITAFNEKMVELCREKGWYFVDVASVMKDENGKLIASYCSDPNDGGIHFTDAGCKAWVDYLYTHTA